MQVFCAPMEGVTGKVFRAAHRRWFPGVDRYYAPFVSPRSEHVFTARERRELEPESQADLDTVVPQLLTRKAEDFLWAAGELAAMGYREVDLNLGCPSGTVTAKGKGSGFLAFPDELERFLETIYADPPLAVSIKTRLGVADPAEFPLLLERFDRFPIPLLIVHPRVRADFYRGPVRMDSFAYAAEHAHAPLCYNGDLTTGSECADLARRFPAVEAVMLGRGLVADPALADKVKGGTGADLARLRSYHAALYEGYAAAFGSRPNAVMRMKEFWSYFICLFEDGDRAFHALKKTTRPAEYEQQVERIFRGSPLRGDASPSWKQ